MRWVVTMLPTTAAALTVSTVGTESGKKIAY